MFKEYIYLEKLNAFQKSRIREFNNSKSYQYEKTNCELCSGDQFKVFFNNDRYGIILKTGICLYCGFFYSNPRLNSKSSNDFYNSDLYRLIYDGLEKNHTKNDIYNNLCKEIENYTVKKPKVPNFDVYYKNLYFDFINYYIQDFDTVFDIGCGKGLKLLDYKSLDKKVYGIEPSKIYHECHKKYGINSKVGFINDINDNYDLVIITHVLEHLSNLKEVFKKLESITKKYLFIEVPGHVHKLQSIQNAHNHYFSLNTLNYFVENNNFKLIKMEYAKDNEFILALYEKTEKKNSFSFYHAGEKKMVRKIYLKYNLKYIILKIIKTIKLESFLRPLYNKIKFFFIK